MDGSLVFSAKIIAASWPRKWCSRLLLLTVKWNVRWMQIKLTMTVWQSIVCQGSRCWFHLIVGVAQDLLFQKFRADQMQASLKSAPRGDTTSSTSWASALTPHTSAQVVEICWADVHTDLLILVNIHDETKWHTCTTLSYTKRSRYGDRTYEYTSARTMTVVHQHQLELCTTMSKVFGMKMYVVRFMTSIHVQKLGQQLHRRFWPYIHRFHQGFVKNYSGEQISRHRGSVTDIPLHRDQARPEVLSLRMRLFEKSSPRMLRSARAWDTGGIWWTS